MFKTIRAKVFFFIFLMLLGTTLLFSVFTTDVMEKHLLKEILQRTELLARSLSASASYHITLKDMLGLDHTLFHAKEKNPDIESIALIDKEGNIIAHTELRKRGTKFEYPHGREIKSTDSLIVKKIENGFNIITPIIFANQHIGNLVMTINDTAIKAADKRIKRNILIIFMIVLFLGAAITMMLSSIITRPVNNLIKGIESLRYNRMDAPLRVYSDDELGRLTHHFNELVNTIFVQQENIRHYAKELEESFISTVRVLAAAIDARDPFTMGHSSRIAILSSKIGERLGLNTAQLEDLEISCLFHDIGKLRIPDAILIKEGALDTAEYREIMKHPEYGAEILRRAPTLHKYIPAVLHHHEWYNGKGYPYGLRGNDIPIFASIISVSDAFDAMTSSRPYRKGLSLKEAIEELTYWSGKQFNPEIVKILLELLEKEGITIFKPRIERLLI